MGRFWSSVTTWSLFLASTTFATSNTYDYVVVGSGPGGGPLAAKLAKHGSSVLLLEAGDDQGENLNQKVAGWFFNSYQDPSQTWEFFVKYHSDDAITREYEHLTWRTSDGQFYVGTDPPAGSTMLGVYYPRAGTLGGCSAHNAMCAVLPSNSDWNYIAQLTHDQSWTAANMRKYFEEFEHNNYLPKGTPGHGFNGYLDISLNDHEPLGNNSNAQVVLRSVAEASGQDKSKLFDLIETDLNNASPNRDQQTGIWGFPAHRTPGGVRSGSRDAILPILNAKNHDGSQKYPLALKLNSLVTKVLFNTSRNGHKPVATGVEYLSGQSLYSADPRYDPSNNGTKMTAFARKEVIIAGGTFNSPQILKLSGIGPKAELEEFGIPVIVDLPGVGANLQDNTEFSYIADASQAFTSIAPQCTFGAPGDPCLAAWYQGKGPYTSGPLDSVMFKSSKAVGNERDILIWSDNNPYRGYWPAVTVNPIPFDPPTAWNFAIVKIHPQNSAGTVLLRSADARDVPDINFRFFEGNTTAADLDIEAMAEAVEFGRRALNLTDAATLGPWTESFPCQGNHTCDVDEIIRKQTWSHHATSTCAIGSENDPMAVLDSHFRVRGVDGLRVVDASAFPRTPGAFPVLPVFMISGKAADVILADNE
ncbi:hypothetical protein F5884DRAFT_879142 [Xylogone sp. PMI_703]|nr:hypothetical protein F5884DRAFT_879142 [Xylogone sp. PMI_703]